MSQNEYLVKVKEGWILLAYSKKGLCSLNFPVKRKPVILSRKPPLFIVKLEKELKNYFSGKKQKPRKKYPTERHVLTLKSQKK